jgi:hypothetical protein
MTITDLKQAKKKVLQMHPDKSHLPPEYFLFYKRAYEKIVDLYDDLDRQNRRPTKESTKYNTNILASNGRETVFDFDHSIKKQIDKRGADDTEKFNRDFNDLFEKNMLQRPNAAKNNWFCAEVDDTTAPYKVPTTGVSVGTIGKIMEDMKTAAASSALTLRNREVKDYYHSGGVSVSNLYEDDDNNYICASGGGLQYDDIRKVHKNETIIPVGTAKDIAAETGARAITLDDFISQRETTDLPVAEEAARRILAEKTQIEKAAIMEKQHRSNLQTEEWGEKNKTILAQMRRICTGIIS